MHTELVIPSISELSVKITKTSPRVKTESLCDWHIHNESELFLLTDGTRRFFFNDAEVVLEEGDLIFINGKVPHKTIAPVGSMGILIQFQTGMDAADETYRKVLDFFWQKNQGYFWWKKGTNKELKQCICDISREYSEKQNAYATFIKSYIYKIFAILYRNNVLNNASNAVDEKGIQKLIPAFNYIDSNYTSQIKLEHIAQCIHVDKSYVCRLFKQTLGISFVDYLNYVRLYNSRKTLLSTQKSISEIAYENGFSSTAYYIKCFKNCFFCTPLAYRKMYHSNRDF